METLLRLESDVIELIATLGGEAAPRIGPENFLGLELNPRAAVIAELVLWIGWLRWRTANDPGAVPDPVLRRTTAINFGGRHGYDAVLARDDAGEVARPPAPAAWPEAEFIVGNPPFIGGKNLRDRLGSPYAEALWKANPSVPPSADFVMQWWDRAADTLTTPDTPLRRFGLVTTNSITQEFSRRVIARHINSSPERGGGPRPQGVVEGDGGEADAAASIPLHQPSAGPPPRSGEEWNATISLVMACPDHPWTKATRDSAAVRIAMTVAEAGKHEGELIEVERESGLDTDTPQLFVSKTRSRIHPNLSTGTDLAAVRPLTASDGLSSPGIKLHGAGFIVTSKIADLLGWNSREGARDRIRPYRNGRDLLQRSRDAQIIDLHGLTERQVRQAFPEIWAHLDQTVRDERRKQVERSPTADAKAYLESWWLFGKTRRELREALDGLPRFIVTVETAKHRVFQFLDGATLPDNMLIAVASDDPFHLSVLSSRIHIEWAIRTGGTLEDRPRYTKAKVFDPFPFPDPTLDQRTAIADLGEELDATRKAALAEHPRLTMTGLYNLVEKLRAGVTLTPSEENDARDARARIVRHLHDQLDRAVAAAYGWADDWERGDLTPTEIVTRLVTLNAQRAAEEATGQIRWLRPDYQIPRFGPDARTKRKRG